MKIRVGRFVFDIEESRFLGSKYLPGSKVTLYRRKADGIYFTVTEEENSIVGATLTEVQAKKWFCKTIWKRQKMKDCRHFRYLFREAFNCEYDPELFMKKRKRKKNNGD